MGMKKQMVVLEVTYDDTEHDSPDNWVWFDLLDTQPEWARLVGWGPVENAPPAPDAEPEPEPDLLTGIEAAKFLEVSNRTLQRWRDAQKGPPFIRLPSGHTRYSREALTKWTDARRRNG